MLLVVATVSLVVAVSTVVLGRRRTAGSDVHGLARRRRAQRDAAYAAGGQNLFG
ncbi:MAG: hypothetical protein AAFP84_15465 [Actinomycetota bacterium]